MIKPNELRTGNTLQYYIGEEGLTWEPVTIGWQDIKWCEENNETFNKRHKPIPITEEIIAKTYFHRDTLNDNVKTEMRKNEEGNWFAIIHLSTSTHLYIWHTGQIDVGKITHLSHIKYLHQLQNLFNILTDNELLYMGAVAEKNNI